MLSQRVFQIACGYEDAADADTLRTDPAMKMACDQLPEGGALASQPTLSRLENAVTRTDLYRIGAALVESFIDSYRMPPVAILLDIDDTADTTHGHQLTPRVIYEKLYSDRGTMELLIKDHKTHLHSDRTSCHRFEANQFRLFLHSMAYVLTQTLRSRHLQGTPWARAQFDTIRLQVLKIGARVRQLRTRVKIHLPTSYP